MQMHLHIYIYIYIYLYLPSGGLPKAGRVSDLLVQWGSTGPEGVQSPPIRFSARGPRRFAGTRSLFGHACSPTLPAWAMASCGGGTTAASP